MKISKIQMQTAAVPEQERLREKWQVTGVCMIWLFFLATLSVWIGVGCLATSTDTTIGILFLVGAVVLFILDLVVVYQHGWYSKGIEEFTD